MWREARLLQQLLGPRDRLRVLHSHLLLRADPCSEERVRLGPDQGAQSGPGNSKHGKYLSLSPHFNCCDLNTGGHWAGGPRPEQHHPRLAGHSATRHVHV